MKKKLTIICMVFMAICVRGFAQESGYSFDVTIDSVRAITDKPIDTQFLIFYVTIKNKSTKTLEFVSPALSHNTQVQQGWDVKVLKDNIEVYWEEPEMFIYYTNKLNKLKKNKELKMKLTCHLPSMLVADIKGSYSASLELSSHKKKDVPKQTIKSNSLSFEIND